MDKVRSEQVRQLANRIAAQYAENGHVEAVVMGGSQTTGEAGVASDIDLYVYSREEIALELRTRVAESDSLHSEVGNQFWEPGDEWVDRETGIRVDVMFRRIDWIEDQMRAVLERHQASVGYSTCFWHNVLTAVVLFDRNQWFEKLQQSVNREFPEPLRKNIIAKNHPILRESMSSYRAQITSAVKRQDIVSLNHRVAALLAGYFDILFALNRILHPGEKRLLDYVEKRCTVYPLDMRKQVTQLLYARPEQAVDCGE